MIRYRLRLTPQVLTGNFEYPGVIANIEILGNYLFVQRELKCVVSIASI